MKIDAKVSHPMNYDDFLAFDLAATPGLVIEENLISHGRVPRPAEVSAWIQEALKPKQPRPAIQYITPIIRNPFRDRYGFELIWYAGFRRQISIGGGLR